MSLCKLQKILYYEGPKIHCPLTTQGATPPDHHPTLHASQQALHPTSSAQLPCQPM